MMSLCLRLRILLPGLVLLLVLPESADASPACSSAPCWVDAVRGSELHQGRKRHRKKRRAVRRRKMARGKKIVPPPASYLGPSATGR